jgi:hypothetical protein
MTTDEPVDYSSEKIHEEVELLLSADDHRDILRLVMYDPKFYIGIIQNYQRTRDGTEISLPTLLNINPTRSKGRLSIKYRMHDNARWEEVGWRDGHATDDDVYDAFVKKVQVYLESWSGDVGDVERTRAHVMNSFESVVPEKDQYATKVVSQGLQTNLTALDRFRKRNDQPVEQSVEFVLASAPSTTRNEAAVENIAPPEDEPERHSTTITELVQPVNIVFTSGGESEFKRQVTISELEELKQIASSLSKGRNVDDLLYAIDREISVQRERQLVQMLRNMSRSFSFPPLENFLDRHNF